MPNGNPNPVKPGSKVNCTVSAEDTMGHELSYHWDAIEGSFDNANTQSPIWTSPKNTSGFSKFYTIICTVTCNNGKSVIGHYQQEVNSYIQKGDSFVCWDALKRLGKNDESVIDSEFLSFTVAPAINAAGRLDTAKPAGDLFLTDDRSQAFELANQLAVFNDKRKQIEREMTKKAKERIDLEIGTPISR